MPPEIRSAALGIFNHLFALGPEQSPDGERQPKVVTLDADAKAEFVAFYNSVGADAADADEREEAAWHKLTGYGARLALLGELARHDVERISGNVMQAATELARWFGAESKRIYAMLAETPATASLRRLCEFISRRGGVVTVRDVITCYRPLRNQTDLAEVQLNQLVSGGLGEWMPMSTSTKGGRPTRAFRLLADKVDSVQIAVPPEPENQPELAEAMIL